MSSVVGIWKLESAVQQLGVDLRRLLGVDEDGPRVDDNDGEQPVQPHMLMSILDKSQIPQPCECCFDTDSDLDVVSESTVASLGLAGFPTRTITVDLIYKPHVNLRIMLHILGDDEFSSKYRVTHAGVDEVPVNSMILRRDTFTRDDLLGELAKEHQRDVTITLGEARIRRTRPDKDKIGDLVAQVSELRSLVKGALRAQDG